MEVLLGFTDDQLSELMERLAHHAWCKMKRLSWRGSYLHKGGTVPGGYQSPDIAADAVARMLEGKLHGTGMNIPTLKMP